MKVLKDTKWFKFHNANPKNRRSGDCVIRAISTATGKSWEEVLTDLCKLALQEKRIPNEVECYGKYLENLGWKKQKQPRKSNNTKFTGREFVTHFKGVAIAHIGGNHIVCIKEGQVWDTWDSTDGCIGNFWIK